MKNTNTKIKSLLVCLLLGLGVTQVMAQCPRPTGLAVSNVNSTTVTMTWSAVGNADSYRVSVDNASGNNQVFNFEANSNTTSYTLGGLTPGANYKFKVRSKCGGNQSDWTAWFNFTTDGGSGACTTPTNLTVTNKTATSAQLNWTSTGAPNYRVRVEDASGNNQVFNFSTTTSATSYTIQGLNPSSHYKFKVRSLCGGGNNSNWSVWRGFFTTAARMAQPETGVITLATVYPNPATDYVKLDLNDELDGTVEITMVDLTGRVVYSNTLNAADAAELTIPISDVPAGFYQVTVKSASQVQNNKINVTH